MVCGWRTAPLTTVSTRPFRMTGFIESFMHNTILNSDKMAVVGVHILLCGPSELTVVNDIIRAILCPESILGNNIPIHIIATDTKTDITNNKILRSAAIDLVMRDDDAHPGSRLSG